MAVSPPLAEILTNGSVVSRNGRLLVGHPQSLAASAMRSARCILGRLLVGHPVRTRSRRPSSLRHLPRWRDDRPVGRRDIHHVSVPARRPSTRRKRCIVATHARMPPLPADPLPTFRTMNLNTLSCGGSLSATQVPRHSSAPPARPAKCRPSPSASQAAHTRGAVPRMSRLRRRSAWYLRREASRCSRFCRAFEHVAEHVFVFGMASARSREIRLPHTSHDFMAINLQRCARYCQQFLYKKMRRSY